MLHKHLAVPLQEEFAVLGAPAAILVEEARLLGPLRVGAAIVGASLTVGRPTNLAKQQERSYPKVSFPCSVMSADALR